MYNLTVRIQSLILDQFRSYQSLNLSFDGARRELFLGPNGTGKTNLLEAVSVVSTLGSFLGVDAAYLVRWGTGYFRITATVETDAGEQRKLEVVHTTEPTRERACFVDDVRMTAQPFLGQLPTMVFLPEDLNLFTGGPERRRQFLDQALWQLQPASRRLSSEYERILKQRNSLLKRIGEGQARESELDLWDSELSTHGARLQQERLQIVERLNHTLPERFQLLGGTWRYSSLSYERRHGQDGSSLEDDLSALLTARRQRDILLKSTSVGPHRDDWRLLADNRDIATFASRGEQRTSLIALLLTNLAVFDAEQRERPIILLDDVFSELDDAHQRDLVEALSGHQVLMTATHLPPNAEKLHPLKLPLSSAKLARW